MASGKFDAKEQVSTPQLSQIEVRFKAPLVKDSIVGTVADLLTLNTTYSYPHKHIWVRETESYWYIEDRIDEMGKQFDGSKEYHWKEQSSRSQLRLWDKSKSYKVGDCVYWKGKIYTCIKYIRKPQIGQEPVEIVNETYWDVICGEIETYSFEFESKGVVYIDTEVRNPHFEIMLGKILKDANGNTVRDEQSGYILFENPDEVESVSATIEQERNMARSLPSYRYKITFQEHTKTIEDDSEQSLTGIITVK